MALVSLIAVSQDGREDLYVRFAEDDSFSCSFSGTAPAVDFESTGVSAGRMVKNDYLCSVRVVTDARGEVLERNDYSGFGKRLASSVILPAGQPRTLWLRSIPASARMSTAMTIR